MHLGIPLSVFLLGGDGYKSIWYGHKVKGPYIQAYITRHFAGSIADDMCKISGIVQIFHEI